MQCPKCGYILPEDSTFCQYCGEKLTVLPGTNSNSRMPEVSRKILEEQICTSAVVEKSPQEMGISAIHGDNESSCPDAPLLAEKETQNVIQNNSARENSPTVHNTKKRFCKQCGGLIDPKSKKCASCGKQYFRLSKKVFPVAIFIVMLIALAGLNIFQYISYNRAKESTYSIIDNLEEQMKKNDSKIAKLENKAEHYDDVCHFFSSGNIGYAADNFKVNQSVVLVRQSDTSKKITLTAYWSIGGTVTTSRSTAMADVVFDDESWAQTTTLTIKPYAEGVSIITFSNNIDLKTFKIMIIVTE